MPKVTTRPRQDSEDDLSPSAIARSNRGGYLPEEIMRKAKFADPDTPPAQCLTDAILHAFPEVLQVASFSSHALTNLLNAALIQLFPQPLPSEDHIPRPHLTDLNQFLAYQYCQRLEPRNRREIHLVMHACFDQFSSLHENLSLEDRKKRIRDALGRLHSLYTYLWENCPRSLRGTLRRSLRSVLPRIRAAISSAGVQDTEDYFRIFGSEFTQPEEEGGPEVRK